MNPICQGRSWLIAFAVATVMVYSAPGQSVTNSSVPVFLPPLPPTAVTLPPSPVVYFRRLLAMSPQQLQSTLAKKSPAVRARILAKVNEYAALDPSERELRLCATDLRWYFTSLLHSPSDQRNSELASVPDDIRDLVQSRLTQWEMLPPPLQQEFLDNEHILGYFSGMGAVNSGAAATKPSSAEQSRWDALSDGEHQAMISQFNQFFELSVEEKQMALGELTDAERRQMDRTLQTFNSLPPQERRECLNAFGKFAGMSRADRAEFLKNAARRAQGLARPGGPRTPVAGAASGNHTTAFTLPAASAGCPCPCRHQPGLKWIPKLRVCFLIFIPFKFD
jgi:hypothetical protein